MEFSPFGGKGRHILNIYQSSLCSLCDSIHFTVSKVFHEILLVLRKSPQVSHSVIIVTEMLQVLLRGMTLSQRNGLNNGLEHGVKCETALLLPFAL